MSGFSREIGPRKVGGRYHNGYWGAVHEVWADGHETTHCTAWDSKRDRVLS